jgi:hypothetical protein
VGNDAEIADIGRGRRHFVGARISFGGMQPGPSRLTLGSSQ